MTVLATLQHVTHYQYDRAVMLGPQTVRLHPTPHSRARVSAYALTVMPASHLIHWQVDPLANQTARLVFANKCTEFKLIVSLQVLLVALNPFDFLLDPNASNYPFSYSQSDQLALRPYFGDGPASPRNEPLEAFLASLALQAGDTLGIIMRLNQAVFGAVRYQQRYEPGVQPPEQTLRLGSGSCRDSGWLLVQLLRRCGMAARFVSGYLVEMPASIAADAGSAHGQRASRSELHAWCEVYLPGAGWIGLDPTSGLLTGSGHIALACALQPAWAAPVEGVTEAARVQFSHQIDVSFADELPK